MTQDEDLEDLYEHFEMLAPLVISRPKDRVILVGNIFSRNMGLFGGVLAFRSPNWSAGQSPVLVLKDNKYDIHTAYLSGSNIHFYGVKQKETDFLCGGFHA